MNIEVSRKQLLKLIGNDPGAGSYDWVISAQERQLGYMSGGFKEAWNWNFNKLESMSDQELLCLFDELKGA